jgi:hypothetical protein
MNTFMKLYHYTRRVTLPNILREGLSRGDVPLDRSTGINAPCLTVMDTPPHGVFCTRETGAYNKAGVRITVEIDPADSSLLRWKHFPDRFNVDRRFFRMLNSICKVGNPVYDWYIYLGRISPSSFVEVYDILKREPIHPAQWPVIALEPLAANRLPSSVKVLSFADAAMNQ